MPMFKPLLAEAPEPRFPLRFPFFASPKYDGIRCMIRPEGPVTRKLKAIPNRQLREMLAQPAFSWLDGELLAGSPAAKNAMQVTTTAVMSHAADFTQVTYYVFDHTAAPERPYQERLDMAAGAIEQLLDMRMPVVLVPQTLIYSEQELERYEESCLAEGYEGVIIRSPGAHYKFGRSTAKEQIMLKIKRFVDTEGAIVGFYEQEENTNEQTRDELGYAKRSSHQEGKVGKGTLGGMIVQLDQDKWREQTVRVGTGQGWTQEFRQFVWDNQEQFLERVLKYKYQECGSKDAPRIPIGLGFRHPDDLGEGEL